MSPQSRAGRLPFEISSRADDLFVSPFPCSSPSLLILSVPTDNPLLPLCDTPPPSLRSRPHLGRLYAPFSSSVKHLPRLAFVPGSVLPSSLSNLLSSYDINVTWTPLLSLPIHQHPPNSTTTMIAVDLLSRTSRGDPSFFVICTIMTTFDDISSFLVSSFYASLRFHLFLFPPGFLAA